jgi:hypothetical protein
MRMACGKSRTYRSYIPLESKETSACTVKIILRILLRRIHIRNLRVISFACSGKLSAPDRDQIVISNSVSNLKIIH